MTLPLLERNRIAVREYKKRNPEKVRAARQLYKQRPRLDPSRPIVLTTHAREYNRQFNSRDYVKKASVRLAIRTAIFDLLGWKCALCPCDNKLVLQIDHVNGGGNAHRKKVGMTQYFRDILRQIQEGSKGFRILCANCNLLEAIRLGTRKSVWN